MPAVYIPRGNASENFGTSSAQAMEPRAAALRPLHPGVEMSGDLPVLPMGPAVQRFDMSPATDESQRGRQMDRLSAPSEPVFRGGLASPSRSLEPGNRPETGLITQDSSGTVLIPNGMGGPTRLPFHLLYPAYARARANDWGSTMGSLQKW